MTSWTSSRPCAVLESGGVCTKGLAVLLGNGDGTFKGAVKYDSGGVFAMSIGVSDLNRDGKPDVWIAGGSTEDPIAGKSVVNVLFGNGNGTFRKPVALDAGVGSAQALATQDVNGDGVPDVVVLNQYGPIAVLLGHGDGTFAPALSFALPNPFDSARIDTAKSIAMGDMNGDGRPDVVFTGSPVSSAIVKLAVMFNNGGPHSPSTTKLVSSVNPAAPNQPVTYSATVEGESGKPITGTITFVDGSSKIEEVPLDGNRASVTTSYKWNDPVRNHVIAALYSGNLYDAGSTSATLTQYVGNFPVPTKVIVTSSLTTAVLGQPITFMANVKPADARYDVIPDGEVVWFYDGTTVLGSAPLTGGVAQFTTAALSARTHTIKATYPGSAIFKPGTNSVSQVVTQPSSTPLEP